MKTSTRSVIDFADDSESFDKMHNAGDLDNIS